MVAAYKVPLVEEMVARALAHVSTANLPNLILGEMVVPELLQRNCTAEKLAAALQPLLSDTLERQRQLDAFTRLDKIFDTGGEEPSAKAARIVLEVVDNKR